MSSSIYGRELETRNRLRDKASFQLIPMAEPEWRPASREERSFSSCDFERRETAITKSSTAILYPNFNIVPLAPSCCRPSENDLQPCLIPVELASYLVARLKPSPDGDINQGGGVFSSVRALTIRTLSHFHPNGVLSRGFLD